MNHDAFTSGGEVKGMLCAPRRLNLKRLWACLILLWGVLLSFQLQAQQTYDFSSPAALSGKSSSWPWNTTATVQIGGVSYTLTSGGNGSFTNLASGGNGSSAALRKDGSGGDSFTLKRTDGGRFQFFGLWLKQSSMSPYPGVPPIYTVSLQDEGMTVKTYTVNDANTTINYAENVGVTSVTFNFKALLYYIVDDIKVGPAAINLASLTTSAATGVGGTFATVPASITGTGGGAITERGIVWSTSQNPTTVNSKMVAGSGSGSFSAKLTGLNTTTTYYVRAYAVNAAGTAYGNQVSFTTSNVAGPTIWNGPKITFTKANNADYTQAANQDRLTDQTWLTRKNVEGLFNSKQEPGYNFANSPANTEWAYGTLDNYATLTYRDWTDFNGWAPPSMIGKDAVLHLIAEDIYIGIKFLSWSSGGSGGGYSYERTTAGAPALSSNANLSGLTLSSGILSPAFGAATTSYTAAVPTATTSVTLRPVMADANATVTVNGAAVVSGHASQEISLKVGTNTISTLVTAQDGSTKTYTVTVSRAGIGNILYLTDNVSGAPALAYETYLNNMGYAVMLVNMAGLTAADLASADVAVMGYEAYAGLDATKAQLLKASGKPLIGVTYSAMKYASAIGGYYTKSGGSMGDTQDVGYKARSSAVFNQPNLITADIIQVLQNPESVEAYYMGRMTDSQYANVVSWLGLNSGQSHSLLYREGKELFYWGFRQAPDKWTETGKKLFVNLIEYARAGEKDEHILSFPALATKQASDPAFTLTASATSRVALTYASSNTAVASVSGNTVTLNGDGTTTITATAPVTEVYRETTATQSLQVVKSSNANLASISLSAGSLAPAFDQGTAGYTVAVAHDVASIAITPSLADTKATVTVDGSVVASGSAKTIALTAGNTKHVPIVVTAQDGTTKTYALDIARSFPPLSVIISSSENVSCNGGSNGSATVSASGGAGPYTYSWSPSGGAGATASGLSAGYYAATVTDANGQEASVQVLISQPAALYASVSSQTNVACNGGTNGAATVTAAGGTAPYKYSWSNGASTPSATGLLAGNYTVTITDANNCVATASVTITQPAALYASVATTSVTTVGGRDGEATVTATGGTGAYTYRWSPSGGVGATASGLTAGTYSVTVTDANDCAVTQTVTIQEPTVTKVVSVTPTAASPTNAAAVNFSVVFDQPVSGVSAGNFSLTASGVSGANITGVTPVNSTTYLVTLHTGTVSGELSLSFNNDAGLSLEVENLPFTGSEKYVVDKDKPLVTGVMDKGFYNSTVTIGFNEGTAQLNGSAFASGTMLSAEGAYTLVVTDAAANATTLSFTIDRTNPVVNGVADRGTYNTDRTIGFDEGTATLNGVSFTKGTVVREEGAYTLTVRDAATNTTTVTFEIDKTSPTGALAINNGGGFTNTLAVTLQITAADAGGTGVTEMRIFNSGGTPGAWEPVSATKAWTLSSGEGAKTVQAELKDAAGNIALLASQITYDATRPRVAVSSEVSAATNAAFGVTFTFSEGVDGFAVEDIRVENGVASAFTKVSGEVYTAFISPAAEGVVKVSIAADKAVDPALNGNAASNEVTAVYDLTKPGIALHAIAAEHVNAPFTMTFGFSEPVTGFTLADIVVTNGAAAYLESANGQEYTAVITPAEDGAVQVAVAAGAAFDAAANGNEASAVLSRLYDATKPTVTVATTAADPTNAPFTATFSFSEEVLGFELGDITVTNGAASEFIKVDGQTYTVLVTPAADGEVGVALAAGVARDEATNPSQASEALRRRYDATAPAGYAVSFHTSRVDITNVTATDLSITGAEVGTSYTYAISSENGGTPVTGTAQVSEASFELRALDLSGLNDGTLNVTLYLVDPAGNRGADARAQVVKITRDIVAVTAPALVKVPIRTTYANVPLPAKVAVTYATGEKEELPVTWSQGDYNGLVAGAYALTGELVLAPMTTNLSSRTAGITVEVQPNKVPTALSFSTASFKPEATAAEAIGSFTTTDADDDTFSYALVEGEGSEDNGLFELRGEELYLKSNKGLSGITQLSIRVRSTDPYENTIEKSFTLSKRLYAKPQDELKIVNAFSPDGDGINDTWFIPELRFYNQVEIEVFDRSGVRLFHTTNPEEGWNGKDANGQVRKGAFLFIVQVGDINLVKKGVVTILKK
ncbi:Ig-like domain-containing protein [Pontibacter mangrovi]|uniref:T9SS type B sorting domain-containing protein n=1 Tax=Pontibacter mangrovi TaxID=2589816 RepID=A0A501WA01_9BACT|nr:Ig-like domain-containing protein [Pontibacter mangrovi]TPE42396.1 T9SS type B sorting domain-containing protein [Pontibacter mangrovi]